MQVYTLYELNTYLRQVLALNFQQPLWIAAELASVGQSRGHWYFDLVQKGEGDALLAQGQAMLWAADYRRMRAAKGTALDAVLREGLEIKLQVKIDFHERYGLKYQVLDLDPAYSLGQLELLRRQTIQTLQQLGLLARNRALPLPTVLQRVAVISSGGAAGFQDFLKQLTDNPFGYRFFCDLLDVAVQGKAAEAEINAALALVAQRRDRYDCAVILRGGGARTDLGVFDSLELCKAAAHCPLPLFTGIGHDTDESILDLVAHTALKTPTAAADFLVQRNLHFETALLQLAAVAREHGEHALKTALLEIKATESALQWGVRENLRSAVQRIQVVEDRLPALAAQTFRGHVAALEHAEVVCRAFDPAGVLRRGYSITTKNGKAVRAAFEIAEGDVLETKLQDGVVRSVAQ
jgi:exodeoxyribonuclease VII large subunit